MKKYILIGSIVLLSTVLIVFPIGVYTYKFGIGIWDNHEDWSRMGSYFGGVLGPILTSISILFLGYQIHLQTTQKNQEHKNLICNECEHDILTAAKELEIYFSDAENFSKLQSMILEFKQTIESKKSTEAFNLLHTYIENHLAIISMWDNLDASIRKIFDYDKRKYTRIRSLLYSKLNLEVMIILDSIQNNISISSRPYLLELDKNK